MTVKARTLKEKKVKAIEAIKEKISSSSVIILTNYRGMTVKQVTELKRALRAQDAEYKVYKNTLVEKALPQELIGLKDHLKGPIAIVFGKGDIGAPAKVVIKFLGDNERPLVISGVVENQIFLEKQIKELAKLPSKLELIAKVIGGMKSPLYGLVNVTQGPIRKLVYALNSIKEKKESQGGEK